MKLNMASGVMQSLVLFAQTITLINHTPSFIQVPKIFHIPTRIHIFLLGFFSLHLCDLVHFVFGKEPQCLTTWCFTIYVTTLFNIVCLY